MIKFKEIMAENRILIIKRKLSKNELLKKMSSLYKSDPKISKPENILQDILAREEIISTGIGAGIAIPHIHKEYIEGVNCAFAVVKESIDFDSMDNIPINFAIMILTSGKEHKRYLQTVAKFAKLLKEKEVKSDLLSCNSPEEILNILIKHENNY